MKNRKTVSGNLDPNPKMELFSGKDCLKLMIIGSQDKESQDMKHEKRLENDF